MELLFDSLSQPVTAGARASVASARQLLYRVGTVYVDLRVDMESDSQQAVLVGQLLDSSKPGHPISDVRVSIRSGRKKFSESVSNANGEFQMEFPVQSNMEVTLQLTEKEKVSLPLTGIDHRKHGQDSPTRGARF